MLIVIAILLALILMGVIRICLNQSLLNKQAIINTSALIKAINRNGKANG
jgi:hypothetical protein